MRTRKIKVDMLSRVEGEGSLVVKIRPDSAVDVELGIFEPPRFFEAFLVGRDHREVPDLTARICGICPIAYQVSSATAIERALRIELSKNLNDLRRLIYCGEWIESHALHVHLLHAPDFLGFNDAIEMAPHAPGAVERGLRIKKLGNKIMSIVGGREIHPINIRIGGFYSSPPLNSIRSLRDEVENALEDAIEAARWTATLRFRRFEPETCFVAMRHPTDYPIFEGKIVSTDGLSLEFEEFEHEFVESHEQHSHALHGRRKNGQCYHVGPVARFNLNRDRLHPISAQLADELIPEPQVLNPFKSIIVRSIETIYALEEALRLIDNYSPPTEPSVPYKLRAGTGFGCSEAPRGICWHRYDLDDEGLVTRAVIVPPTSQNQPRIEQDLRELVPLVQQFDDDKLLWICEQAIRNYDPCISCATHHLRFKVDRRS